MEPRMSLAFLLLLGASTASHGATLSGQPAQTDVAYWSGAELVGFDGEAIKFTGDSGHYYNVFSIDDGPQVALYLKSREPGGIAYVKGVGLRHKDVHVVVEPAYFGDGFRAWLALVNGRLVEPSGKEGPSIQEFTAKDGSKIRIEQEGFYAGVAPVLNIISPLINIKISTDTVVDTLSQLQALRLEFRVAAPPNGPVQGILAESYATRPSATSAGSARSAGISRAVQNARKLPLPLPISVYKQDTYFDTPPRTSFPAVSLRKGVMRSLKLEMDEADPDMPLTASWGRTAGIYGLRG